MGPAFLNLEESGQTDISDFSRLANLLKAVSDPLRLEILRVMRHDSFGVLELAAIFDMPQPGMSHHLKLLSSAGLLTTRRQGNTIFYRRSLIVEENVFSEMKKSLFCAVDALELGSDVQARIQRVYSDRSFQSRNFFDRHAAEFLENQGRLCEVSQYIFGMQELLDLTKLPRSSKVMEVGPGQGVFLKELAGRYDHLVALDSSGEMLALAKENLKESAEKIEFIQGSIENYREQNEKFDAIVLNMVMHHLPSPAQLFKHLSTIVAEGGYVLVAELCSHHQSWVKDSCGDLWLGFEPEELGVWSQEGCFAEFQSLYLGLKNGFQIQLRLFKKKV